MRARATLRLVLLLLALAWLPACQPTLGAGSVRDWLQDLGRGRVQGTDTLSVTIRADGQDVELRTEVRTVREALDQAGIAVGAEDHVEPDLWVDLQDGMTVRVVRVQEEIIVERQVLPYAQKTIKSEALPAGETRLLQAGANGQAEITYRIQFQDGVETSRSVLRQVVVQDPSPQIVVVGVEGMVSSVDLSGTIVYLNDGNAWLMRGASGRRRPVTGEGNLDGRIFTLSPDGDYLLYSVPVESDSFDGPFNELYLLDVSTPDDATPTRLPLEDVLWADWAPCGPGRGACGRIAYSTGERSGPPGWRANNDLWAADVLADEIKSVHLMDTQTEGAYSWWGSRFAWSPDGKKLAYARPDQLGWIEVRTRRVFPLAVYPPQAPRGANLDDPVWLPTPTWSPDSLFIACTLHGEEPGRPADQSRLFELWAIDLENTVRARLTRSIGMWSMPRWSPAIRLSSAPGTETADSRIAYARAHTPSDSYESRYTLMVMDRDGSNKRALFPAQDQSGMPRPFDYRWSPGGDQLVVLYHGDLYLVALQEGGAASGEAQQLTGDGQCTHVDWAD
jgi:Tol biopolymer transport system component